MPPILTKSISTLGMYKPSSLGSPGGDSDDDYPAAKPTPSGGRRGDMGDSGKGRASYGSASKPSSSAATRGFDFDDDDDELLKGLAPPKVGAILSVSR